MPRPGEAITGHGGPTGEAHPARRSGQPQRRKQRGADKSPPLRGGIPPRRGGERGQAPPERGVRRPSCQPAHSARAAQPRPKKQRRQPGRAHLRRLMIAQRSRPPQRANPQAAGRGTQARLAARGARTAAEAGRGRAANPGRGRRHNRSAAGWARPQTAAAGSTPRSKGAGRGRKGPKAARIGTGRAAGAAPSARPRRPRKLAANKGAGGQDKKHEGQCPPGNKGGAVHVQPHKAPPFPPSRRWDVARPHECGRAFLFPF